MLQIKYAELLAILENCEEEITLTYAVHMSAVERLKGDIICAQ